MEMNTHDRLERIFKDAFSIEKLTDDLSIDNVPGWDSMAHVALIMTLQQEFGIAITPAEAIELTDIASIKNYLRSVAH
ncbi:MAG: acyl carrier protein [Planctomycetaceae bacterium]|nr:acyl carrier protein [Planctomycetaceae bacterium]